MLKIGVRLDYFQGNGEYLGMAIGYGRMVKPVLTAESPKADHLGAALCFAGKFPAQFIIETAEFYRGLVSGVGDIVIPIQCAVFYFRVGPQIGLGNGGFSRIVKYAGANLGNECCCFITVAV